MRRRPYRNVLKAALPDSSLPDAWPGVCVTEGRGIKGINDEIFISAGYVPEWGAWTRVTVIGHDSLAISGIRHLLAQYGNIRLKVYQHPPLLQEGLPEQPDVVIWVRTWPDGMPELAGYVIAFCRRYPTLRQLVISDFLPSGLCSGFSSIAGVWQVSGREKLTTIDSFLKLALLTPRRAGPLLKHRLSRMQWQIVLLRAAGANTDSITHACGLEMKKVYMLEATARQRLGVKNRVDYAWLLRSVERIAEAIPALKPKSLHKLKETFL